MLLTDSRSEKNCEEGCFDHLSKRNKRRKRRRRKGKDKRRRRSLDGAVVGADESYLSLFLSSSVQTICMDGVSLKELAGDEMVRVCVCVCV